jgi:hypothetical protein
MRGSSFLAVAGLRPRLHRATVLTTSVTGVTVSTIILLSVQVNVGLPATAHLLHEWPRSREDR